MRTCTMFMLAVLSAGQAVAQNRIDNPILPHPDPFITHDPATADGKYVLTATTGKNITLWSGPSPAASASNPRVVFNAIEGMTQVWSPTVCKMDGHWWIYFTALMPGDRHAIYVLESDSDDVLGAYTYKGKLDTGRPSIDPSLLIVNGVHYLMYVTVDRGENAIWIRKLANPTKFDGAAALIAEPQYPWEKGQGTDQNYPVDEGPTALYHGSQTFIVFSASHTATPKYCLGLLTLTGKDPMHASSWKKTPTPVFEESPAHGIYGPGRGSFAQAKDGTEWLLYAAKVDARMTNAGRQTRAQKFTWAPDGTPAFGVPDADGRIQP